jgi:phosphoribosyl 1,2-cyclic phosphodiesterase
LKVKIWGARGSVPAPGPETTRYGGNTSCVTVALSDGSTIVLDAGTGIRNLGLAMAHCEGPLHILLTHLHLDHIQGLMFFAPAFRPETEIVIWGPASNDASLQDRIARYISAPLTPVEVRELPCSVSFRECEGTEWPIGPATVSATSITHRGPTLGYRVEDNGASVVYMPDHEPALGADLTQLEDDWISGLTLAREASLLIHDCQYADDEYSDHLGWGHTALSDALTFGLRAGVDRLLLFHHDPLHSDDWLDDFAGTAQAGWVERGGAPEALSLARELLEVDLAARPLSSSP